MASILAAPGVDELVLVNHGNPPEMIQSLRAMAADRENFVLVETGSALVRSLADPTSDVFLL